MSSFKKAKTFEDRQSLANKHRKEHPEKVPVIVEPGKGEKRFVKHDKMLVPGDSTMAVLTNNIRLELQLLPNEALFFMVDGDKMAVLSSTVEEVYQQYKDADGHLYVNYYAENVFG